MGRYDTLLSLPAWEPRQGDIMRNTSGCTGCHVMVVASHRPPSRHDLLKDTFSKISCGCQAAGVIVVLLIPDQHDNPISQSITETD